MYYQAVPVLSLLHSIIDSDHSERTYKFQLQAYDLPTTKKETIVFSQLILSLSLILNLNLKTETETETKPKLKPKPLKSNPNFLKSLA
jgi:hypothetical protein